MGKKKMKKDPVPRTAPAPKPPKFPRNRSGPCSICGATISRRKSIATPIGRVCKHHTVQCFVCRKLVPYENCVMTRQGWACKTHAGIQRHAISVSMDPDKREGEETC